MRTIHVFSQLSLIYYEKCGLKNYALPQDTAIQFSPYPWKRQTFFKVSLTVGQGRNSFECLFLFSCVFLMVSLDA